MGFFITLLIWALVFVASELIRPKPKFEDARPAGLGDFRFPTATEGRAVPLIWGTVKIEGPNVVWYGNLRIERITEEVKTGLFSSDDVTTGYRYYVGMQFALCRGPVDSCNAVWIDEKIASGGRVGAGFMSVSADLGGDRTGSGNLSGSGQFYVGNNTQTGDSYLSSHQSPLPAYRGTCYWVFEDGLVGQSPNLPRFAFEITRIPDPLNMAVEDPGAEAVNTEDANPMNVLYEILTDTDWGLGILTSEVDITNFRTVASTLAAEGNGFSMILDRELEVSDFIQEIERQIDGVLYYDREDAAWKVQLARDDYAPASLIVFDETNVLEVGDFARTTWDDTTNQVRILFADREDSWKESYAVAQDMANVELQGRNVSADIRFPGVKNRTLANKLAWRELATLAYPLAKATLVLNREAYLLKPGDVFKWSNAGLGISELILRVTRINHGTLQDGKIRVSCVEDVFQSVATAYSDPPVSNWTGQTAPPVAVVSADTLIFEAPWQMVRQDSFDRNLFPRIWCGARNPGGGTVAFQIYDRFGTAQPIAGDADPDATIGRFLLAGSLTNAIDEYGTSEARPDTSYNIDLDDVDPDDLSSLENERAFSFIRNLLNIVYVDGEFIGYETLSDVGGGVFRMTYLYRGLFHTAPKAHAAGARVWFIGQTGGNLTQNPIADNETEADIFLRSQSYDDIISEAATPEEELTLERVHLFPLAPRDPVVNSTYAPSSEDIDSNYSTETGLSGDDALGMEVTVTPRLWRKEDVLEDLIYTNAEETEWLEDNPEFDFSLILDPSGTPAETAAVTHAATDKDAVTDYLLRNAAIEALGANRAIPSAGQLKVVARHTPVEGSTVYTNSVPMLFALTITSALQGADDLVFGAFAVSGTISDVVAIGETGTLDFDIKTALPSSGVLEGRLNGGSFVTIVAAAATTGSIAVTAGDDLELRFTQAPAADQFFDIAGSGGSSEQGYGVLLA